MVVVVVGGLESYDFSFRLLLHVCPSRVPSRSRSQSQSRGKHAQGVLAEWTVMEGRPGAHKAAYILGTLGTRATNT